MGSLNHKISLETTASICFLILCCEDKRDREALVGAPIRVEKFYVTAAGMGSADCDVFSVSPSPRHLSPDECLHEASQEYRFCDNHRQRKQCRTVHGLSPPKIVRLQGAVVRKTHSPQQWQRSFLRNLRGMECASERELAS